MNDDDTQGIGSLFFITFITIVIPLSMIIAIIGWALTGKEENEQLIPKEKDMDVFICPKCQEIIMKGKVCSCGTASVPVEEWVDQQDWS